MHAPSGVYSAFAVCVLLLHALFIVWVVFGAFVTRSRPILRWLHIASLLWGILTELTPWPCPLTVLENWLEAKAGVQPYHGGFLLHYMDKVVYPDISATKTFKVPHWESAHFGVGAQFFNIFNHPHFDQPDADLASPTFGQIINPVASPTSIFGSFLGADASPRLIQLHGTFTF